MVWAALAARTKKNKPQHKSDGSGRAQPGRSLSNRRLTANAAVILAACLSMYDNVQFTIGIASQGDTVEEARANTEEAALLFLETAPPSEIQRRLKRASR